MAADGPYPPLRGLTVCKRDSGCLESERAQGEAIPLPLMDWMGVTPTNPRLQVPPFAPHILS